MNYEAIKSKVKRKVDHILRNSMEAGRKKGKRSKSLDFKTPDGTDSNKETENGNSITQNVENKDELRPRITGGRDRALEVEESRNSLKIDNIVNQKLIGVLSKNLLETISNKEISSDKLNNDQSGTKGLEGNFPDFTRINITRSFDFDSTSKLPRNLNSDKRHTTGWETVNISEAEPIAKEINNKQTVGNRNELKEENAESKVSSERNSIGNTKKSKVSVPNQAFESRLTKHMYSNNEDDADDILDREPNFLQTNNFTSKQPISKTRSGGYNFFGKAKTSTAKQSKSPKDKNRESTDTDGTASKRDVLSQPSSMKESSHNTFTPQSSRECTSHDSENRTEGINQDIFLIKAPYNISTSSTSESNFQIRPNSSRPKENRKGNPKDVIVNLDCGDVTPPGITGIASQNRIALGNKDLIAEISHSFGKSQRALTSKSQESVGTTKAYLVSNERKVNAKVESAVASPRDEVPFAGTIRSIAKAIQDGEDSDSSFELDDFLEKNNMG